MKNRVVVAHELWFEIYKQGSEEAFSKALTILSDYPSRVLALKSTADIMRLPARDCQASAMLDERPELLRETLAVVSRNAIESSEVQRQLHDLWKNAAITDNAMLEGAADIVAALPDMQAELFGPGEIRRLRTGQYMTHDMVENVFGAVDQIAGTFCEMLREPYDEADPKRVDRFPYRLSMGILVRLLIWIKSGLQGKKHLAATRNDTIDLFLAVHATYFDGLLSRDKNARSIFHELACFLRASRNLMAGSDPARSAERFPH